MTATVARYTDRILRADQRATRGADRSLGVPPPGPCWTFGGWLNWPFGSNPGGAVRIRHMCTNACIYPCAWYDETGWTVDDTAAVYARLDTLKPTMGHETSSPAYGPGYGSWFQSGTVTPRTSADGPGVPAVWPWVDVCNGCWNFSAFQWFATTVPNDWDFAARHFQLLEVMQSTDSARRLRKSGTPTSASYYYGAPAMDWPCFADQVPPGALVSLALTIEVYKSQNKTTRAYGSVVNIWVSGKISVRVPLISAP